jgi:murein DD-endopeptidase MepM/ murein hydrolase activator NlpD
MEKFERRDNDRRDDDEGRQKKPASVMVVIGQVAALTAGIAAAIVLFAVFIFPMATLKAEPIDLPATASTADMGFLSANMAHYAGVFDTEATLAPNLNDDPIPLDMMETFSWIEYIVQDGDSVYSIARDNGISMDAIIASNGLTNARFVYKGQKIRIPNMDGIPYTVKAGDSLTKIASSTGVPVNAILDANDLDTEVVHPGAVLFLPGARMNSTELKMALGELFKYPIRGRLTSPFGWRNDPISGVRRYHNAVDLAAPQGTRINAAQDGTITKVGYNATYGNFVIIDHGGGYQTMYAHMHRVSVKRGARISQGNKIGEVGTTGYSTGPHLHFSIYKNNKPINPLEFLKY